MVALGLVTTEHLEGEFMLRSEEGEEEEQQEFYTTQKCLERSGCLPERMKGR